MRHRVSPELVRRVLADPEWTRRVVEAAGEALMHLTANTSDVTSDGDDFRLFPRNCLAQAFVDYGKIRDIRR